MILTTIRLTVKAAKVGDVLQSIRCTLEPTRVETGCLEYLCCRDVEDPNTILIFQMWEKEEDFQRHVQSKPFRAVLGALDLARQRPGVSIHHVSETEGIETIQRLCEAEDEKGSVCVKV
jgi:quinol monooxygenase YgiN